MEACHTKAEVSLRIINTSKLQKIWDESTEFNVLRVDLSHCQNQTLRATGSKFVWKFYSKMLKTITTSIQKQSK